MTPKSSMFFKVLLNRFQPGASEAFLKSLAQEDAKEVLKQTISSPEVLPAVTLPYDVLNRTHYSWFLPTIEQLPPSLKNLTVASLPERHSSGLKKLLKLKDTPAPPQIMKNFLVSQFLKKWLPKEIIPVQYLQLSPLTPLLQLSKEQLVEIIDLLALHDLAESIRHIVDKRNLTAIYQTLNPKQQQFLRICLHKKEKIAAPKLDIEKWNGSHEKLQTMLHHRGLLRLGKALCGQHSQFLWYLVHTLDTGRGTVITQYYHEDEIPGVSSLLAQQVISVINFLQKGET